MTRAVTILPFAVKDICPIKTGTAADTPGDRLTVSNSEDQTSESEWKGSVVPCWASQ